LPSDLAQVLNQQMESLTRVKSLNGLVEQLLQGQPQGATSPPPTTSTPSQVSGRQTVNREHLTQTLVELVSDRTGYPGEMLGLDQDLEAELGIDSIKRVEILGALAKMLPSDLAQVLNQQMESLTRVKSLNGLVDKLLSTQTSGPSELSLGKSNGETLLEVERSVSPTVTAIPRYVMQPVTEVLPQGKITKLEGLFLITEDQLSCCHHLALLLEQRGAKTAIIKGEILGYPQKLALEVKELQQKLGSVAGIVHLAGLAPLNLPQSLGQWRQYTASEAKSLFYLLSLCQDDLQKAASEKGAYVLSASLFGGYFGRQNISNIGLATAGAGVGLLKTLITEWEQINAKAIDCDPNLSPEMISEQILSELLNPGRLEVGYPQGQRTIFQTVLAPLHPTQSLTQVPQADWVVLVTGGAMGITAEIVNDLAGIGLTLILIGRSPYPEAESPTTQGVEDVATLRKLLLQQELAQGSKPTPVQIEAKIQKLQRQRQLRQNVERFQQAGAKVEYHSVDVRNESEFGAVIEGIYQGYSRLDAVIHGAGIIEDKLIIDKTPESLDRVFDTKVDSAFILTQHLRPEQLKLLVFFTSVAGRYGNRGQSDYAAANEVVTRLAWQLQSQWRNTHVVAINWGPWDTAGMASEGVKRQFRERGIIPIPLEGGCHFFEQEIASGDSKTTEVIAGEGPWEAYEAAQTHHNPIEASDSVVSVKYPLLLQQPELQPNGSVTLEHTFTLASDRYLKDHCLDQKPVLPAAGALEWMAELVEQAWPDWVVTEVRDLRVMRGLVLEGNDGKLVLFKARASTHADSSSLMVTVEIVDPDKKLPYYRAAVVLQPEITNSPPLEAISVISGQSLHPQQAYEDYLFHGQYFQLITAIDHLNEQGIDAQVIPSRPSEWLQRLETASSQWLFDPGLIDTAPQLAIVWARVQGDTTALPSCFGSVKRYDGSQTPQPLKIAFRVNQFDGNSLNYDAIFFDNNRKVHFHLQDISGTCNATLNRLAKS
ncbi:MAG: SDR family NAD(P)-dependent oxidoreductase, partial [Crocosphaera sp.]